MAFSPRAGNLLTLQTLTPALCVERPLRECYPSSPLQSILQVESFSQAHTRCNAPFSEWPDLNRRPLDPHQRPSKGFEDLHLEEFSEFLFRVINR